MDRAELREGFLLCIENARRLLDDAKLVSNGGSKPTSFFLVVTALEEIVKAFFISKYDDRPEMWSEKLWRHLSTHEDRWSAFVFEICARLPPELLVSHPVYLLQDYVKGLFGKGGYRNMSLYVDWKDGRFEGPSYHEWPLESFLEWAEGVIEGVASLANSRSTKAHSGLSSVR
jgi:AbiV family abortive infection protein